MGCYTSSQIDFSKGAPEKTPLQQKEGHHKQQNSISISIVGASADNQDSKTATQTRPDKPSVNLLQQKKLERPSDLLQPPRSQKNDILPDDFDAKTLALHSLLYKGQLFKKINRYGIAQKRFFWVDSTRNHLMWIKEGGDKEKFSGRVWIARIKTIIPEKSKTSAGFTIVSPSRSLQVICDTKSTQDKWIEALELVMQEKQPLETESMRSSYNNDSD